MKLIALSAFQKKWVYAVNYPFFIVDTQIFLFKYIIISCEKIVGQKVGIWLKNPKMLWKGHSRQKLLYKRF